MPQKEKYILPHPYVLAVIAHKYQPLGLLSNRTGGFYILIHNTMNTNENAVNTASEIQSLKAEISDLKNKLGIYDADVVQKTDTGDEFKYPEGIEQSNSRLNIYLREMRDRGVRTIDEARLYLMSDFCGNVMPDINRDEIRNIFVATFKK